MLSWHDSYIKQEMTYKPSKLGQSDQSSWSEFTSIGLCVQSYKSVGLYIVDMICGTLVNTQRDSFSLVIVLAQPSVELKIKYLSVVESYSIAIQVEVK